MLRVLCVQATQRHTERLAETEAKDALRLAKEEAESSALIHVSELPPCGSPLRVKPPATRG